MSFLSLLSTKVQELTAASGCATEILDCGKDYCKNCMPPFLCIPMFLRSGQPTLAHIASPEQKETLQQAKNCTRVGEHRQPALEAASSAPNDFGLFKPQPLPSRWLPPRPAGSLANRLPNGMEAIVGPIPQTNAHALQSLGANPRIGYRVAITHYHIDPYDWAQSRLRHI